MREYHNRDQKHKRRDRGRFRKQGNGQTDHRSNPIRPKQSNRNQRTQKRQRNEKSSNQENTTFKVNRRQRCPFLVIVHYAINDENTFKNLSEVPVNRQVHLHLWKDCSLRQITELLRAHLPEIRTKQRFVFTKIHTIASTKELVKQEMGTILMHKRFEKQDIKTLFSCKFQIGDSIDVSINYK